MNLGLHMLTRPPNANAEKNVKIKSAKNPALMITNTEGDNVGVTHEYTVWNFNRDYTISPVNNRNLVLAAQDIKFKDVFQTSGSWDIINRKLAQENTGKIVKLIDRRDITRHKYWDWNKYDNTISLREIRFKDFVLSDDGSKLIVTYKYLHDGGRYNKKWKLSPIDTEEKCKYQSNLNSVECRKWCEHNPDLCELVKENIRKRVEQFDCFTISNGNSLNILYAGFCFFLMILIIRILLLLYR